MRIPYLLVLLVCGLLSTGIGCGQELGQLQCEEASECNDFCAESCGDRQVKSFTCESNLCVCECEDMGAGGTGGSPTEG